MDQSVSFQLLQNVFHDLSTNDIRSLSQAASVRDCHADEYICRQGDAGTTLFVIGSGEVDIIVHAKDDNDILVDTLGAGNYFGEMAFLGETTRMATVRTRTACQMLEIDQDDFMAIARTNPSLLRTLLRQIINHLRNNDQAVIRELNIKNAALANAFADLAEQEALRTQFIATLSHELRTPLTSAKGFLSLINQGVVQGDALEMAMTAITRNVETMVGLTNDLLILYEMHPAEAEYGYYGVAGIVMQALSVAKDVMKGRPAEVELDISPDLPEIHVDKRGLVLALRAIIENAFKFNPNGEPVAIRAFVVNDSEVAISVEDKGVGIPVEAQERIFEPFIRVEKEGGAYLFPGLGVGLTVARFLVKKHNGSIHVDSQLNRGSIFTVTIPIDGAKTASA